MTKIILLNGEKSLKRCLNTFIFALLNELFYTKNLLYVDGKIKKQQFLVGFALETQNEEENAKSKLQKKNLDMIVLALPFDTRGLKVAEITKENLFVVYNKNDKNAENANSLDDLDLSRLMLLEEGHCLRDHALSACPVGERKNDHRLKASSLPTLIEMVSSDLGFTLLPEIALKNSMIHFNEEIAVKSIEAAPSRTLALVTRKSTPLQSEFDVLLQIFQKITKNLH